jgi:hypothetical protein
MIIGLFGKIGLKMLKNRLKQTDVYIKLRSIKGFINNVRIQKKLSYFSPLYTDITTDISGLSIIFSFRISFFTTLS